MINVNKIHSPTIISKGFTLVELMLTIAIIGVISSIAIPSYQNYTEKAKVTQAIMDISTMGAVISHYYDKNRIYPQTLNEVNLASKLDPWGNPYQYLNLDENGKGGARKDKKFNPLNSDFDLYSNGKNGGSHTQISITPGDDDVIRANDGSFINLASKY
jgi:general secretion pathway protein G